MLSNFCCFSRINTSALFFERRLLRLLRKPITVVHTGVSSFKERKLTEPFRLQEKTTHYQAYCPTRSIKDSKHPDYTLNHHDLWAGSFKVYNTAALRVPRICLLYTNLSSNKISLHLSGVGGSFDQGHPYDGRLPDKVRPRHPCGSGQACHPTAPSGVAKQDAWLARWCYNWNTLESRQMMLQRRCRHRQRRWAAGHFDPICFDWCKCNCSARSASGVGIIHACMPVRPSWRALFLLCVGRWGFVIDIITCFFICIWEANAVVSWHCGVTALITLNLYVLINNTTYLFFN